MKTSIRLAPFVAVFLVTSAFAEDLQPAPEIAMLIGPQHQTVRIGEPVNVSVRLTNGSPREFKVEFTPTAFDCFEVIGPDGQKLPYVGFDGQIAAMPVTVPPASTHTFADALDLTEKYIFAKEGTYSIRYTGKLNRLSDAHPISVDAKAGELSAEDQIVLALMPVCPQGWRVVKDSVRDVTPFGRARAAGFSLHVCHSHMRGEAVYFWFTTREAPLDPNSQSPAQSDYLGRHRGLFVYRTIGTHTPPLWPTAADDLSRALPINKP